MKTEELLKKVVEVYGKDAQLDMLVEECSELIKAVMKLKRKSGDDEDKIFNVCDEIADVYILLAQMRNIFPESVIEDRMAFKLLRLEDRLKKRSVI
jgi:NTP pyrophosphatase (non-canonical NTP hydrolase)